jgi:uncharacterized protein with NRDE domain
MCIVLASTAHPAYALIVIDNRDEFILRPTSRPHWWHSHHQHILSARDLQRAEQGTWLGITKSGNFAVLTNYRETDANDAEHPIQGTRSRGGMVTAWLTAPKGESTVEFVHRLLEGDGVKGVGGFSLLCGKLRKRARNGRRETDPLAIVSNRAGTADDVPWIAEQRDAVYGLSNTFYADPEAWPKVEMGKEKLMRVLHSAAAANLSEEDVVKELFGVLDTNTLPPADGASFEDYIFQLRKSIFIPSIGTADPPAPDAPLEAQPVVVEGQQGTVIVASETVEGEADALDRLEESERPDREAPVAMTGAYGTQRQTVMLVDWNGKVTFIERSLWDGLGRPIPRGEGDARFEFMVEGWDAGEEQAAGVRPPQAHI